MSLSVAEIDVIINGIIATFYADFDLLKRCDDSFGDLDKLTTDMKTLVDLLYKFAKLRKEKVNE